ncbi:MAG: hypothetical protein M0Q42_12545 [Xanthomonadales bacterium]|nr:hypothetical protein [Xanthomonadales bacterium]
MRKLTLIFLLLSCVALVACGGSDPGAAGGQAAAPSGLKGLDSACGIFSEAEFRQSFSIADGMELEVSESGGSFPACNYQWGEDLVLRTIKAGGREIDIHEPAKVMLVVARGVSVDNFNTSTSVYMDPEDVPGIGDMARWGGRMSQLSFLAGGDLFHINVKASSDKEENRRLAEGLAQRLLQKL